MWWLWLWRLLPVWRLWLWRLLPVWRLLWLCWLLLVVTVQVSHNSR